MQTRLSQSITPTTKEPKRRTTAALVANGICRGRESERERVSEREGEIAIKWLLFELLRTLLLRLLALAKDDRQTDERTDGRADRQTDGELLRK